MGSYSVKMQRRNQCTNKYVSLTGSPDIHEERLGLYWIPVLLLPTGNLLPFFWAQVSFSWHTLLLSLIGALVEEMLFRGFLLKTILLPRINPILAISLSAVLFALMHVFNLWSGAQFPAVLMQIFCALCFGIWAGTVVWHKNGILIPVLAHVLLNLTAITEEKILPLIVSIAVLIDGILLIRSSHGENTINKNQIACD